jgi:hypothetical protein
LPFHQRTEQLHRRGELQRVATGHRLTALGHRQPTLLLTRHLSRAEPGQGLPQVELAPGSSLIRRSIEHS